MLYYSHLTECIYPYLFSVDTLQCENFTDVNCGRHFEEKYQCKLLTFEVFIMAKSTVPIVNRCCVKAWALLPQFVDVVMKYPTQCNDFYSRVFQIWILIFDYLLTIFIKSWKYTWNVLHSPSISFFFNTNQRSKNLLKHSWYISFNLIYDNLFLAAASQESNFKSTINVEWVVYSDTFQLLKRFTPEPLQSFSFENELIVHYYFPPFIWYS